ncbi:MAG: uridine kinase [Candidatus Gastranaerophilaceae bacterium]
MAEYILSKTAETTNTKKQVSKKMYVSVPFNRVQAVEEKLKKIFEEELKSDGSILLSYKPSIISKLARFLSGHITRPASIGIAGETASGKSTITLDIIDTIKSFATEFEIEDAITRVNTDDYYYDRSEMVKAAGSFAEFAKHYDLDVPQALELELMSEHVKELLNGKSVLLPKYDMSGTAIRYDNHTLAQPSKIIISEGLFALTEKIKDAFDFKIYVDVRPEIQKERFFVRAAERDLGESAKGIYKNASQKAEIYIRPCKNDADIVLSGEAVRARYKSFLNKLISIVQQENFRNKVIM